jgi:hypothetical protein
MLRTWLLDRTLIRAVVSAVTGITGLSLCPFPGHTDILQVLRLHAPHMYHSVRYTYMALSFGTPYVLASTVLSLGYIFWLRRAPRRRGRALPPYPRPERRTELSLVLGEVHHPTRVMQVDQPGWLQIADRGLYTGVMVVGAVGSGKTSGCMYPYVEQLLAYQASDPDGRLSALILEVKGDFCTGVREILRRHGREEDYVEIGSISWFVSQYGGAAQRHVHQSRRESGRPAWTSLTCLPGWLRDGWDDFGGDGNTFRCESVGIFTSEQIGSYQREGSLGCPQGYFMTALNVERNLTRCSTTGRKMSTSTTVRVGDPNSSEITECGGFSSRTAGVMVAFRKDTHRIFCSAIER